MTTHLTLAQLKEAGIELGDKIEVTTLNPVTRTGVLMESILEPGRAAIRRERDGIYSIRADEVVKLVEPELVDGELYRPVGKFADTLFRWCAKDQWFTPVVQQDGSPARTIHVYPRDLDRVKRVKIEVVEIV